MTKGTGEATSTELATKQIEIGLVTLRQQCEAIVVANQQQYIEACELVKTGRAYIKDVGFKLDPGIESARTHLDFLRNEKNKFVEPAKAVIAIAEGKAEAWKRAEREAAQREQERIRQQAEAEAKARAEAERREADRLAEERRKEQFAEAERQRIEREKELEAQRKAGEINKREMEKAKKAEAERQAALAKQREQELADAKALAAKQAAETAVAVPEIKVEPNVPKVAGIKARINWKFRIVKPALIPRAFLMADEVAIGQMVRSAKDKARAEAQCPGIEVYSEDGI